MREERVAGCRCGHLWTVHLEGRCDGAKSDCDCRGFYPDDWRPNTTDTCRGCRHDKSLHAGTSCSASVGRDTVTERHFGFDGDTWTTEGTVEIRCSCQRFW
ncbi:hypothetical protein ACFYVL_33760 [Streptomyces sp. NPDC004111]|uniref:hypothetical protein n=1 Tax=Streptomyces sp. NPDC004111 TaxID=3364690 RepID=UPI0036CE1B42